MEAQSQGSQGSLMIQAIANMFVCKKAFPYFVKKEKSQQKNLLHFMKFMLFGLFLMAANQAFYFLTVPQNLYSQAGVTRKMTFSEVSNAISNRKADILQQDTLDLQYRMSRVTYYDDIQKVLTHSARRLTYDAFGLVGVEYAWSFTFPSFILSMIIQNSIYYLICLLMNLLNRDKRQLQSAFKYQLIFIILMFIIETQIIVHTSDRLNHPTDLLDYIYPAFPMFERRQVLKSAIIPMSFLIDQFYMLFITSDAEKTLQSLVSWLKPGLLMDLRGRLKGLDITNNNKHLEEQLDAALESEKNKAKDQEGKDKVDIYRTLRRIIQKFLTLQGGSIVRDGSLDRTRNEFAIQMW